MLNLRFVRLIDSCVSLFFFFFGGGGGGGGVRDASITVDFQ